MPCDVDASGRKRCVLSRVRRMQMLCARVGIHPSPVVPSSLNVENEKCAISRQTSLVWCAVSI